MDDPRLLLCDEATANIDLVLDGECGCAESVRVSTESKPQALADCAAKSAARMQRSVRNIVFGELTSELIWVPSGLNLERVLIAEFYRDDIDVHLN